MSHEVFKELIKTLHPLNATADLVIKKKITVCYVAGYVCRKVHDCLKQSSTSGREAMMLYLSDMYGWDIDEESQTDAWLRMMEGFGG